MDIVSGNCLGVKAYFEFNGFISPGVFRFYLTRLFIYNLNGALWVWCWAGLDLIFDGIHMCVGYEELAPRCVINVIFLVLANVGLISTGACLHACLHVPVCVYMLVCTRAHDNRCRVQERCQDNWDPKVTTTTWRVWRLARSALTLAAERA